jgi:predicted nuclease of predicted toxin-antitoxin system
VRLLFDHNLSPRLVRLLSDVYPGARHVRDLGLECASDTTIWDHARAQNLVIVSKDSDFHQRSLLLLHPPKVLWIRRGNCSTGEIAALLRDAHEDVRAFVAHADASFLIVE